jgi:hypothetical protein
MIVSDRRDSAQKENRNGSSEHSENFIPDAGNFYLVLCKEEPNNQPFAKALKRA